MRRWALLRWKLANLPHLLRGVPGILGARILGVAHAEGRLYARVLRADGRVDDLGLISTRVVTTAGVTFLANAFRGTTEPETMRFHGAGTGTTAEAVGDTALGAEATTALNPDSTRATGTLAGTGNVFTTVGVVSFDAAAAVTEHGVFSQAAVPGGTLWDRSVFAAQNVAGGDSIEFTHETTFPAGG